MLRDASGGWLRGLDRYRRLAIITTVGICVLVVAGGVVRLTGSGLGCDDWPSCNAERFVDVSSGHTAIEQANRLLSGVIGLPTLLLAVAAFRQQPRRLGLRWPAVGVFLSVFANGVVGGIAVRADLHPALVQSHFLLAMVSITFGMIAIRRSAETQPDAARFEPRTRQLATTVAVLTAAALATGTVVTGTGPHAGEEDVRRFGFEISHVARIHSVTVIFALVVAVALVVQLRSDKPAQRRLGGTLSAWIFVGLLQGGVGYTQYFNGVPEVLVGVHIALATALWVISMQLFVFACAIEIVKPALKVEPQPLARV
ncbi:MAG: cytochrome c oxidase assembly protein subunit 15 [Candidatus Azotimanducaceae bacterium]|jgi:cytochrome c oxidase assembly protein subunit 15|tara:strand:- start:977 stop:1915 length:939 start_codon:yes stop_codon:yes gene_type:complete